MTLAPTSELATFIAGLRYEDLPSRVRQRAEDITLDTVASALAGCHGDQLPQMRALARALGTSREATVIAGEPLSLAGATLLNGYLVSAVTISDVHRPSFCNVTPSVIPPALAVAERLDASGQDLLLAVAAGLEAATRIGLGVNYPAFRARGWHAPGVFGQFGGAVAAGKLLGLDADGLRDALGLAGSQAAGTFAAWGTPTVKFVQARGALAGLMAALLAEQGFRSSQEVLTHPDGGLYNTYSDGGQPEAVVAELGRHWELENITLRMWPGAHSTQSLVTGLFALIGAHDLHPKDVRQVRVGLSEAVYKMHGTLSWDDKFLALLSTRYLTAVVLHDRQCWLDQFTQERIQDPAVGAFARDRIKVEIDSSVEGAGSVVEVTTIDGTAYVDRRAAGKGDPSDPLTRVEIQAKFHAASEGLLSSEAAERALELLSDLDRVKHTRELCALLRGPGLSDAS
jgi:2-methylcitrate dehydratase PrpD